MFDHYSGSRVLSGLWRSVSQEAINAQRPVGYEVLIIAFPGGQLEYPVHMVGRGLSNNYADECLGTAALIADESCACETLPRNAVEKQHRNRCPERRPTRHTAMRIGVCSMHNPMSVQRRLEILFGQ